MKRTLSLILAIITAASLFGGWWGGDANEVNVFNWGDYIAPELTRKFEEETGIKVNYMMFTTNEEMLVKVNSQPGAYDLIFPSDYIVERMIAEDKLAAINYDNIPNAANIDALHTSHAYDMGNVYSVPYLWGTMGILYNKEMTGGEVTSWSVLWDDAYQNNVFMQNSMRESLGVALKYLGYSFNDREEAHLAEARDALIDQRNRGLLKAYLVDEIKDKMVAGEAALSVTWSGDALVAMQQNESLDYAIPEEGTNIWYDAMCIPKDAPNKENAEAFINFMLDPENQAINGNYIAYSLPVSAAREYLDEELRDSDVMWPDMAQLESAEIMTDLGDSRELWDEYWTQALNS